MKPKQLRILGTGAALFLGGTLSLNVVSSVTLAALRSVTESRRKNWPPLACHVKAKVFTTASCAEGMPYPFAINPCVCPTCDWNRIQRCLNCLGKGHR